MMSLNVDCNSISIKTPEQIATMPATAKTLLDR